MKLYKLLLLLCISTFILFTTYYSDAQEIIIPLEPAQVSSEEILSNSSDTVVYLKDTNNNLDKFVGNWLYDDGTHYLAIEVEKFEHKPVNMFDFSIGNNFQDILFIKLEYRLNGVVIKYNFENPTEIRGNLIINSNVINLLYNEPSLISCRRENNARLSLEYLLNGPNNEQLIWTRENRVTESFSIFKCPDGSEYDRSDFIIPENLVLTKQ